MEDFSHGDQGDQPQAVEPVIHGPLYKGIKGTWKGKNPEILLKGNKTQRHKGTKTQRKPASKIIGCRLSLCLCVFVFYFRFTS